MTFSAPSGPSSPTAAAASQRRPELGIMFFGDDEHPSSRHDYGLYLECGIRADQLGFCAIWTPERHFTDVGAASPNPAILSAALATCTSRIELRAGSVVAPLHHPVQIAEDWAIVDRLSHGRVGVSFASGWVPDDFIFTPENYARRHEVMRLTIEEVRSLWRGGARPYRNGVGAPADIVIRPLPTREEIPVWLTAAASAATFQAAGECGANVLTAFLHISRAELEKYIAIYRKARAEAGHDPAAGVVTLMLHTFVAECEASATEESRRALKPYFRAQTALRERVNQSPEKKVLNDKQMELQIAYAVETYLREKSLIGSPASCSSILSELSTLGVDEVACLIDFGIERSKVLNGLELLAGLIPSDGDASSRLATSVA
jgi:natural product biosynthesis luciferase-like monooxygenase protein